MDGIHHAGGEHRLLISFRGSGSEYFRIWIVNLLLILVTLGLYYPFAKLRRMRYFHAATVVGGHALSFHADGWRMWRGYMLMMLLFALYALASQISPLAGAVALLLLAAAWPALWHVSLRFRLGNTGWRGLRAAFTGSRGGAYIALAPWTLPFLAVVLMGVAAGLLQAAAPPADGAVPADGPGLLLALLPLLMPLLVAALLPWAWWRLKRYQHGYYHYAGQTTRLQLRLRSVYALFGQVLLLILGALLAAFVLAAGLIWAFGSASLRQFSLWHWLIVMLPLLIGPYVVTRLQNMLWSTTASEHLRFESRLRWQSMVWLGAKNMLLMVLTLGLYYPFAKVHMARLRLEAVTLWSQVTPDELTSSHAPGQASAAGEAAGDLMGVDFGL